ncbi:MAG: hypothetical protein ACETWR_16020, partial [Anaerolineae bacterium]
MFHEDGTFNFHEEIMALAEEFCQEWVQRRGPFKSRLEGALILNFALCTIKHDLEQLLDQLDAITVDLKAFVPDFYRQVCSLELAP